jgi:hypothetical protein
MLGHLSRGNKKNDSVCKEASFILGVVLYSLLRYSVHNTRTVPVDSLRLTVLEASERRPQQVSSVFARPVLGITMVVSAVLFVFDLALQEI